MFGAQVQEELMLLGLISFCLFFVTQGIAGARGHITVEHFELAHYLLFTIGVSYSLHNLIIYYAMAPYFDHWARNEAAVRSPPPELLEVTLQTNAFQGKAEVARVAEWFVVRSAYLDRFVSH